jgi:hypothetical protein
MGLNGGSVATDSARLYFLVESCDWFQSCFVRCRCMPQSTHRVATAAFWRTFHHDGKVCLESLATLPPFCPRFINESLRKTGLHLPFSEKSCSYLPAFEISRSCRTVPPQAGTLQLREQIHSPYFFSIPMYEYSVVYGILMCTWCPWAFLCGHFVVATPVADCWVAVFRVWASRIRIR